MTTKKKPTATRKKRVPKQAPIDRQKAGIFGDIKYKTVDELTFGENGTCLRLVESEYGNRTYIQLYSSLSKQWNTMHRYDIENNWLSWKALYARIHNRKQRDDGAVGRDLQLDGPPKKSRRKSKPKASVSNTKDSKQRVRKPRSKSS